jgi:hypothetical protein
MLTLLALDRGPDVAAGLGEALGDRPAATAHPEAKAFVNT